MSNTISRADVLPGDTIRVSFKLGTVHIQRTGKVWASDDHGITTEDRGVIWNYGWEGSPVFELLDRPKPPLPDVNGSVIIADDTFGRGATVVLRDGRWEYLQGGIYDLNQLKVWKLAKVVEA